MPAIGKKGCCEQQATESLHCPYDDQVANLLQKHSYNFVLTDPRLPQHPIVFASEGFCQMSGYTRDEVIGRNCRFLQGPDTDKRTILLIRDAIREERPCQVKILNYRKDSTPFWNLFHMAPIFSKDDGTVIHFVGVQTPLEEGLAEKSSAIQFPATSALMSFACETLGSPSGPLDLEPASSSSDPAPGPEAYRRSVSAPAATARDPEEVVLPEGLKLRAKSAVGAVVGQLTTCSSGKVGGAIETRGVELSEAAAAGVVCSSLMLSLTRIQQSFVLADPSLPDMPIVHASDLFLELTGYPREEVVGRNCRFLQGEGTDPEAVKQLREAIAAERACTVRLLNYRKDGTPFYNNLHVSPVRNSCGKVAYFVGVQLDVTAADGMPSQEKGMSMKMKQLGAVGAVRVAVRALQGSGLRRADGGIIQHV